MSKTDITTNWVTISFRVKRYAVQLQVSSGATILTRPVRASEEPLEATNNKFDLFHEKEKEKEERSDNIV